MFIAFYLKQMARLKSLTKKLNVLFKYITINKITKTTDFLKQKL
jgi:hypothetical protein